MRNDKLLLSNSKGEYMKRDISMKNMGERILYNPEDVHQMVDWMGYEINTDNPIQIVNDKEVVETAVLTETACKGLALAKREDEDLYNNWITAFGVIDRLTLDPVPDEAIWDMITELHTTTDSLLEQMGNTRSSRK